MRKRFMCLLLALSLLAAPALAEVYEGTTAALSTVTVLADRGGAIESVPVRAGQRVEAGQALCLTRPEKAFASQDGTVSLIYAEQGEEVSGTVLELAPLERYTIYCTVDKAYQSVAATLVHSGETVYIRCTANGTHCAIGVVTQVDGEEYRVLTLGGELYVGETVYLYRDADFTAASRVGIGTVLVTDTEVYAAEGEITLLRVSEGDYVERGQLLYEIGGGEIAAPVSGILTSLACQAGGEVSEGQAIAEIAPEDALCVEVQVDEAAAARLSPGDAVLLTFAGQEDEDASAGTVIDVSAIAQSELYTVRIRPEAGAPLALGQRVSVRL